MRDTASKCTIVVAMCLFVALPCPAQQMPLAVSIGYDRMSASNIVLTWESIPRPEILRVTSIPYAFWLGSRHRPEILRVTSIPYAFWLAT